MGLGIWSLITGAGKTGDAIDTGLGLVEKAGNGLDVMFHTSEEKARETTADIARNGEMAYKFAKLAQSESGGSAVTRRLFGLIILGNFTLFVLASLGCYLFGDVGKAKGVVELAVGLKLGELAITVIVSVFGYYSFTNRKKK